MITSGMIQNNIFSNISLGIVCPMANERDNARLFVNEVLKKCRHFDFNSLLFFAILDNASKDGTVELLLEMSETVQELQVVYAPENQCVVDAYMRGYKEALNKKCEWVLEIDAGFSHHPSDIPQFFKKMAEGYDSVFGSRFCPGGKFTASPIKRYIISRGGSFLANLLLGTKLTDMTGGFELFTNHALNKILDIGVHSRGSFFQTEIRAHAHKFNITEVPINYRNPSPKNNMKSIINAILNLTRLFSMRLSGNL